MLKTIIIRFFKGFVAGGIASSSMLMATGVTVTSVASLEKFGVAVAVAFITGGLLAIEKSINYTPVAPVDTLPG